MTPHINALETDIAKTVIMPGDPLRAKYIAETYLTDYKLVSSVRNMYAYTGFYKNKRVTVMGSGMGIPSMGIYAYELFKFYDVNTIIRIGTSGTIHKDVKLLDVVLATSSYSVSTFPLLFDGDTEKEYESNKELNHEIMDTAGRLGLNLKTGKIITSDVFDPYVDGDKFMSNFPDEEFLASEMEAFCLFYLAKKLNKRATSLMTVVDSKFDKRSLTSEMREKSLNDMITLALETVSNKN